MKAVILTSNGVLKYQDMEETSCSKDWVKIKVKHVGVCSSDIQRGFNSGAYFYPLVMGHEFSGVVEEVGNADDLVPGDKVAVFPLLPCFKCKSCELENYAQCSDYDYVGSRRHGAYAEYVSVPRWNLLKVDDGIDLRDVAGAEPLSVVIHSLKKMNIIGNDKKTYQNIAILGCGFLSILAMQIIKRFRPEIKITGIDRNDFKLDIAKEYSENQILIRTDEEWDSYLKENDNSFDCVLEATGSPTFFERSLKLSAPQGLVMWMGNITDDLNLSKKDVSSILRKELKIAGTWNSSYPEDWKDALTMIKEGVSPASLVTHSIDLKEIPEYLGRLDKHKKKLEDFHCTKIMANL